MLEHAYYSVISPEGCAGILWKTATEETKPRAADALKLTSQNLKSFGVIDDVIVEPLGGAHREPRAMATTLKTYLVKAIRELRLKKSEKLLDERYEKFRRMGVFEENLPRSAKTS
jgi:acetyl-CoA carboxylase carboxyl transferase subunit alpha